MKNAPRTSASTCLPSLGKVISDEHDCLLILVAEVVQHLRTHYSYIFAEAGMGLQLSDERRGCVTCQKWTSG